MERVETLLNKLNDQVSRKVALQDILITVHMLQSELQHLQQSHPEEQTEAIPAAVHLARVKEVTNVEPGEQLVEVLEVNEEEIQDELEEINKNAEVKVQMATANKPAFDPLEETPTLIQHQARTPAPSQQQSKDEGSLNEKLRTQKQELADALS